MIKMNTDMQHCKINVRNGVRFGELSFDSVFRDDASGSFLPEMQEAIFARH